MPTEVGNKMARIIGAPHGTVSMHENVNVTTAHAHDLIIAAIALSLDNRVATRDKRGFPKIPVLDVVYW